MPVGNAQSPPPKNQYAVISKTIKVVQRCVKKEPWPKERNDNKNLTLSESNILNLKHQNLISLWLPPVTPGRPPAPLRRAPRSHHNWVVRGLGGVRWLQCFTLLCRARCWHTYQPSPPRVRSSSKGMMVNFFGCRGQLKTPKTDKLQDLRVEPRCTSV